MSTGVWIVITIAVMLVGLVVGMAVREYGNSNRGFVLCPRYEKYNAIVAVTNQPHGAICIKFKDTWTLFTHKPTEEAYAPQHYSGPISFRPYNDLTLDILVDLATGKKSATIETWATNTHGVAVLVVK